MRAITIRLVTAAMLACPAVAHAADLDRRLPPSPAGYPGAYGFAPAPAADASSGSLGRPARRVMGGPDYAGSEYGLGKPSYYGMAPRPDWGRSSID